MLAFGDVPLLGDEVDRRGGHVRHGVRRAPRFFGPRFTSLQDLIRSFTRARTPVIALYPSAGSDTRPLSHLCQDHLDASLGPGTVPAPDVLVMVDRRSPLDADEARIAFGDFHTQIRTIGGPVPVQLGAVQGLVMQVEVLSARYPGSHRSVVIRLRAENDDIARRIGGEGWAPDILIGVTDGCRFGDNAGCVMELRCPDRLSPDDLRGLPAPKVVIADHFTNAREDGHRADHALIASRDPEFPFVYRDLGRIGSNWGRYGGGTVRAYRVETVDRRNQLLLWGAAA